MLDAFRRSNSSHIVEGSIYFAVIALVIPSSSAGLRSSPIASTETFNFFDGENHPFCIAILARLTNGCHADLRVWTESVYDAIKCPLG